MDFYQIWNFDLTKLAKIAILVLKICQKKKKMLFLQFQKPEIHKNAHFCPTELAKSTNLVMLKRTVYIRNTVHPFTFDNFQM